MVIYNPIKPPNPSEPGKCRKNEAALRFEAKHEAKKRKTSHIQLRLQVSGFVGELEVA
jgi:hypothetical protein